MTHYYRMPQTAERRPESLIGRGPICLICEEEMLIARVMPFEDEQELHIFECPTCRVSQSRIARFG